MSLSVGSGDVFTIYDVIGKLLPGGLLIAVFIVLFPSGTDTYQIVNDLSVLGTLVLIPIAYVLGGVIESLGGLCIRRGYFFQERIHDARHELATDGGDSGDSDAEAGSNDREESESDDSDHVARETWADIVERFDFPDSYLRAEECMTRDDEECRLETDDRQGPWFYRWIMKPLLAFSARLYPNIPRDQLSHARKQYTEEEPVRRVVVQYLNQNQIGRIARFDSLFVLFRSLSFLSALAFLLSVLFLLVGFAAPFFIEVSVSGGSVSGEFVQSRYAAASLAEAFVVAVASFVVFPILYSRMRHYDKIRDKHTISTYYANVVASGTTAEQ